jgi:hypothetical protein
MTNTNCLEGMRCPGCGSDGPFRISATVLVLVEDDGPADDLSGSEWDDGSYCECDACDHSGIVNDFTIKAAI